MIENRYTKTDQQYFSPLIYRSPRVIYTSEKKSYIKWQLDQIYGVFFLTLMEISP